MKLTIKMKMKGSPQEMKSVHPGFAKVAEHIAKKSGMSLEGAKAALASKTRNASTAAKRKNPRLRRVNG